jgi:hypothetical protein
MFSDLVRSILWDVLLVFSLLWLFVPSPFMRLRYRLSTVLSAGAWRLSPGQFLIDWRACGRVRSTRKMKAFRSERTFCNWSNGVLFGQKTKTSGLMRINLIIIGWILTAVGNHLDKGRMLMAVFRNEDMQNLDWALLQNSPVTLYYCQEILETNLAWLREHDYHVDQFDCSHWQTEKNLHEALAAQFAFPAYYGCNLDALNDCLSDIWPFQKTLAV